MLVYYVYYFDIATLFYLLLIQISFDDAYNHITYIMINFECVVIIEFDEK